MKIQILNRNVHALRNEDISLKVSDAPIAVPKPIAENLDSLWNKKLQQNPKMFNADRFYYLRTEKKDGQVPDLVVARSDYKTFVATLQFLEENPALVESELEGIVNNITIMGEVNILETEDGYMVFGKRSMDVTEEKGKVMLPAGGFMPKHYEGVEPKDIMIPATKQIEAEIGRRTNADELGYLGITRRFDFVAASVDLIFTSLQSIESSTTLVKLYDKARDKWEHDRLLFVPAKPEVLLDLMCNNYMHKGSKIDFSLSGVGPLLLHGRNKFSDLWYIEAVKRLDSLGVPVEETGIDK